MNVRMLFSTVLLICGTTCVAGALALASYIGHESARMQSTLLATIASTAARQGTPVNMTAEWAFQGTAEGLMWGAFGVGAVLLVLGIVQGFIAASTPRSY